MRIFLIASACITLIAGPAFACRGTGEYPKIVEQLEESQSSPQRADLMKMASRGLSMHKVGHRQGDMDKLLVSLRILDELKAEIAPWTYDFNRPDIH